MRYLYGDSSPFPLQYNFLTTLDTFVTCAARAVELEVESQKLQVTTAESLAARTRSLKELEELHLGMMQAVQERAARATQAVAAEYVRQLQEHATRLVGETRASYAQATDNEQTHAQREVGRRRGEIRAAFEAFLTVGRLPTIESRVSMQLDGRQNELSAVFTNPLGIVTSFKLTTAAAPAWQAPRKVSEFAQGVDLQIGLKKSWITRKVQPEIVHLDDFYVGGFELADDSAEIRLRKKPDLKDSLIFTLHRKDTELLAEVQRPEEQPPESVAVDGGDRPQIERLYQLLRTGVAEVLVHKERLLTAQLDGKDVFEQDLTIAFVERLIKMFAPIVGEISRRSTNNLELSLKQESDSGRREEVYLRKKDLASKLEPLPQSSRSLFAPFALTREASSIDIAFED